MSVIEHIEGGIDSKCTKTYSTHSANDTNTITYPKISWTEKYRPLK